MSEHVATSPRMPRPPLGRALVVPPAVGIAVTAAACLAAVAVAPAGARASVVWCGVVAALGVGAAVAVAAYNRQAARVLQGQAEAQRRHAEQLAAQNDRLADEILPAVLKRLRDGEPAQSALGEVPPDVIPAHRRILRALTDEVARVERLRAAAMAACANAAGRVQALATSMLAELREMEERHGEEVLGDLLRIDHSVAQTGRIADSIAVLTGGRSGRRWTKPIVMESILRGAMARISAYQRIRLHSVSEVAIVGYAAEGIIHALAELMDNATNFSPPSEEVHVYVEEVQAGVVVTIEDGGLVMGPAALARAERMVSAPSLDLTTLSGTRLGLAVVGVLARRYGLTVSFRPSSRGGTGVVVMIPRQLITQPRPAGAGARRRDADEGAAQPRQVPALVGAAGSSSGAGGRAASGTGTGGASSHGTAGRDSSAPAGTADPRSARAATAPLPKRPPGQTLAASARPVSSPAPATPSDRPRVNPGVRFGAFRQATQGRRASAGQSTGPLGAAGTAGTAGAAEAAGSGTAEAGAAGAGAAGPAGTGHGGTEATGAGTPGWSTGSGGGAEAAGRGSPPETAGSGHRGWFGADDSR